MNIKKSLPSDSRPGLWSAVLLIFLFALPVVNAAPVHDAAEAGDLAAVKAILEENPHAWDTDDDYAHDAPPGLASSNGHLEVFQLFVANGFPISDDDGEWSSSIQTYNDQGEELPLSDDQRAVLAWGLEQNTDVDGYWYKLTLVDTVRADDLETAELLLQAGITPNYETGGQSSSLDHASSEAMKALLVSYGAESAKKGNLVRKLINSATLFVPMLLLLAGYVYLTIRLSSSKNAKLISIFGGLSFLVAGLMWFGGGVMAREFRMMYSDATAMVLTVLCFKLLPAIILVRAVPLIKRAAQLQMTSADEMLKRDSRAPILYLRSFQNDASYRKRPWWYWLTLWFYPIAIGVPQSSHEQQLTAMLQKVGPVVAIGDPDEELPKLGAHRLYVGHDTWKETVLDLMGKSQIILLRIGLTEGILWELQNAINMLKPEKFVIWIVPGKGSNVDQANKLANHLHEKSAGILPQAIPLEICKQEFIYFSEGWTPHTAKNMKEVFKALQIEEVKPLKPSKVAA